MNWITIRAALKTLIGDLAGLPDGTEFEDQPRPYVGDVSRAIALLSISSVVTIGRDEVRTDYDVARPLCLEMRDVVHGVREFTLGIKVESYEQTDDATALAYCERIRDRMSFTSSLAALRAVQCAYIRHEPTRDLSTARDDRLTSIAVLDIRLRAHVTEADPARYGYMTSVQITGPV
jgi:hypothetical protein